MIFKDEAIQLVHEIRELGFYAQIAYPEYAAEVITDNEKMELIKKERSND